MTTTETRPEPRTAGKPVEESAERSSAPTSTKVLLAIVNDYDVVVEGLAAMMRHHLDRVEVVALDATGGGPSDVSRSTIIDIALIDTFAHSHDDGATLAELLQHRNIEKVVVYSWALDEELVERSLQQGASGYLSKSVPARELVDALERIRQGETVVHPQAPRSASLVAGDWPGREEGLTPRESEVLALITRGLSNEQVATTTRLSPNSVKSYIRGAYRKIGVSSRTQAVLWALDHGFQVERGG